jgi:hypothetical protein
MELTEFKDIFVETIEDEFRPNDAIPEGKGLKVRLNSNIITLDFLDKYKKTLEEARNLIEKDEKEDEEIQTDWVDRISETMRTQAKFLAGGSADERMVAEWGLVKNGKKVPVNEKSMLALGFVGLDRFFNWCLYEAGKPTKKTDRE